MPNLRQFPTPGSPEHNERKERIARQKASAVEQEIEDRLAKDAGVDVRAVSMERLMDVAGAESPEQLEADAEYTGETHALAVRTHNSLRMTLGETMHFPTDIPSDEAFLRQLLGKNYDSYLRQHPLDGLEAQA